MNKAILALTTLTGLTIGMGLFLSDPITQYNRQQMRYQQQAIFDVWLWFYPFLMFIFLGSLAIALVIGLRALQVRLTDPVELDRHREFKRDIWFIEHTNRPHLPSFEGIHTLHYSPRNSDNHSLAITQHQKQPKALTEASMSNIDTSLQSIDLYQVPDFAKALADTRKHRALVLGYDAKAQPILGDTDKTFSISFAGRSGSGKTGACLFSIASFLAIYPDTKIAILDPHRGSPQSLETNLSALSASYFCTPSSDDTSEVLAFCDVLIQEFKSRKAIGDCSQLPYILVVVEELLSLLNGWNSEEIKDSVMELCQCLGYQSRKYKMVGIGVAQMWDAANAKGLKKVFTSSYTCRTSQDDFRNQTGTLAARAKQLPIPVDQLKTGQAYLKTTTGDLHLLNIPHVQPQDLILFAQSLHIPHTNTAVKPVSEIKTVTIENKSNSKETATGQQHSNCNKATSVTHLSAQEQLYINAFVNEGKDASIQAREATGSTTSKAYKSFRADVNEAIKKAMSFS